MVPSEGAAPSAGGGSPTVSPGTSSPSPSSSSTWVVAALVLLLSLPLGTVLDGLFLSGNPGPMQSAPSTWVDRFFTPHNPLPTDISPHQLAEFLSFQLNHLPGFRFVAVEYKPSLFHQALGRLLDALSWAALALVVFVRPICSALGLTQQRGEERGAQTEQLPPWAEALESNRVAAIVTAFFGAQVVRSVLIPNNAFEIFVGENLLWSTLDSGRMPNSRDLMQRLETIGISVREPM
ncbi:UNVERIFIED_CONTAM: Rdx family protein [Hammondia hammondi]|eukprot:XP_008889144.1 Rdx family protein [Hammondia hammondi]